MKRRPIGGIEIDTHYDKAEKLDFELIEVDTGEGKYFEVEVTKKLNNKWIPCFTLHIKEALEIKSIIDQLAYDSQEERHE